MASIIPIVRCLVIIFNLFLILTAASPIGDQRNGQVVAVGNIGNHRKPIVWANYKKLFNKSYSSPQLDSLHRTIFIRRVDILKSLVKYCLSEEHYLLSKSTDSIRSTWATHIEPTVQLFIERFDREQKRTYSSSAGSTLGDLSERELRHQLLELYLDHRRLLRNCCKSTYLELDYDETIDRTVDEIALLGRRDDKLTRLRSCNNTYGGPVN